MQTYLYHKSYMNKLVKLKKTSHIALDINVYLKKILLFCYFLKRGKKYLKLIL